MNRCFPRSSSLPPPPPTPMSATAYPSDVPRAEIYSDSDSSSLDPKDHPFMEPQQLSAHLQTILAKQNFSAAEKKAAYDAIMADHAKEGQNRLKRTSGASGAATMPSGEACARSAGLIGGGALVVGGLAGALSVATAGSVLLGFVGVGAAIVGGGLCLGALVLGRRPSVGAPQRPMLVFNQPDDNAPVAPQRQDSLLVAVHEDGVLVVD